MAHNRFGKERKENAGPLVSIACFAALLALVLSGVASVDHVAKGQERQSLEDAIRRGAAHCYAVEGVYPPSLAYLEAHYGIKFDENRYRVEYEVFASNLCPRITVTELG